MPFIYGLYNEIAKPISFFSKRKAEVKDEPGESGGSGAKKAKKEKDADDAEMKKQSQKIYYYRDNLERALKKTELQDLLSFNNQVT